MDTCVNAKFLGGTADGFNPTGSCILLTVEIKKRKSNILVDCGMFQTSFKETNEKNFKIFQRLYPIKPEQIDAIVLTHVHIDHSGLIPLLVKHGFKGRIYCTEPSANLLPTMLLDSAKVQRSEIGYRVDKRKEQPKMICDSSRKWGGNHDKKKKKCKDLRSKDPLCEPLYDAQDVEHACSLIKNNGYPYEEWIKIDKGIELKFYQSGHVLGGAICVLKIAKCEGFMHLGFSGDLGRFHGVILPPPIRIKEPIDYWFSESTYGGRIHPPREEEIAKLVTIVQRAVAENRKIIIPAFALERTPEIIFILTMLMVEKIIPRIKIFIDSPMAAKLLKIYADAWLTTGLFVGKEKLRFNPFDPAQNRQLIPIESPEASAELTRAPGPNGVISSSGMCNAGRVRNHLRAGLGNPNTTVCLVGYMARGTLGRLLQEGYGLVKMNKEDIIVRAEIQNFASFSGHADSPTLVAYTKSIKTSNLKKIFLVHGEYKGSTDLKLELMKALPMAEENILIPRIGEVQLLK